MVDIATNPEIQTGYPSLSFKRDMLIPCAAKLGEEQLFFFRRSNLNVIALDPWKYRFRTLGHTDVTGKIRITLF